MKRILQNQKGETIVEVLVAFVMLLLFTAIFGVAVRYTRNMAVYSEQRRAEAYALNSTLYPVDNTLVSWTPGSEETYAFTASGGSAGDFTVAGVRLQAYTASATTTDNSETVTYNFYRYASNETLAKEKAALEQTAQGTEE